MIDFDEIPYGRYERTVTDAHFYPGAALPANTEFITPTGSTITSLGANSQHYASVQVNATGTTQTIGFRTNFDINIANYQMVRVDVSGFHFTTTTMNPGLTIANTAKTNGWSVWCPSATPTQLTSRWFGDTGDVTVNYSWGGAEAGRRRSLSLMILPPTKEFFVMSEDQVIWYGTRPNAVLGLSRFWLESNKPTSAVNTDAIRLARFKVTVQHN